MMRRPKWCGLFIAATLALIGCGGGDSASAEADQELAARLEFGSPQSQFDVYEGEVAAVEDIALCMKAQGFEYQPYLYTREMERFPLMVATWADPIEFASTYGYGVTDTDPFADFADQSFGPIDEDYERALYGASVSEMVANDLAPTDGCWGEAIKPGIDAGIEFSQARDDLLSRVDADPDVAAAIREWARCMAEQGYQYESREAVIMSFRDRSQQLMMQSDPGESNEAFAELLDEEIATALTDQRTCLGAELRSLRTERALAIGLSADASAALQVIAGDDTPE